MTYRHILCALVIGISPLLHASEGNGSTPSSQGNSSFEEFSRVVLSPWVYVPAGLGIAAASNFISYCYGKSQERSEHNNEILGKLEKKKNYRKHACFEGLRQSFAQKDYIGPYFAQELHECLEKQTVDQFLETLESSHNDLHSVYTRIQDAQKHNSEHDWTSHIKSAEHELNELSHAIRAIKADKQALSIYRILHQSADNHHEEKLEEIINTHTGDNTTLRNRICEYIDTYYAHPTARAMALHNIRTRMRILDEKRMEIQNKQTTELARHVTQRINSRLEHLSTARNVLLKDNECKRQQDTLDIKQEFSELNKKADKIQEKQDQLQTHTNNNSEAINNKIENLHHKQEQHHDEISNQITHSKDVLSRAVSQIKDTVSSIFECVTSLKDQQDQDKLNAISTPKHTPGDKTESDTGSSHG